MRVLSTGGEVLSNLCYSNAKWGMFLSAQGEYTPPELKLAAPWLDEAATTALVYYGEVYVLFTTKEECVAAYEQTVGDDGPTKSNPYDGPVRVYALTCDSDGVLRNENT